MGKYSNMSIDVLYKMYNSSDNKKKPILKKLIECREKLIRLDNDYRMNIDKLNTHITKEQSGTNDKNSERSDMILESLIATDSGHDEEDIFSGEIEKNFDNTYSNKKLMERMECDKHIYSDKKKMSVLKKPYTSSDDVSNL